MELFSYYNLSESTNVDNVLNRLEKLSCELKIDYSIVSNDEIISIVDLELTEKEINELQKFFDKNDVLPDLDYEDRGYYDDLNFGDDEDYDF